MNTLQTHSKNTVEIDGKTYLTRHWYMEGRQEEGVSGREAHDRFYAQFATDAVRRYVSSCIAPKVWEQLRVCTDPHLNGVMPLSWWDRIDVAQVVGYLYSDCCYVNRPAGRIYWSKGDNICIVKSAVKAILKAWNDNQA